MEELKKFNIPFEREKKYQINYKGKILPHYFYADFVVMDKIILEIKSSSSITNQYLAQGINYLKVSGNQLAIIVNFGESSLNFKRVVLSNNKQLEENQFPLRSNFNNRD
jgi:GxxExxY protein